MEEISMPQMELKPLMDMIMGAELFKTLASAIKYGIFNLCEEPKTAKQISERLDTDYKMTVKLMNSLNAMGLLIKIDDSYKNSPLASTFLVKDKPFYQGDYIKLEDTGYDVWQKWKKALKEGIEPMSIKKKNFEVPPKISRFKEFHLESFRFYHFRKAL